MLILILLRTGHVPGTSGKPWIWTSNLQTIDKIKLDFKLNIISVFMVEKLQWFRLSMYILVAASIPQIFRIVFWHDVSSLDIMV